MSTSNLRPSSTTTVGPGTSVDGAATVHGALSDDSNSTQAVFTESVYGDGAGYAEGALTDFTLPSGAVIKLIRSVVLCFGSTGTGYCIAKLVVDGVTYTGSSLITTSIGARTVLEQTAPAGGWTDSDMDGMTWFLQGFQFSSGALRAIELNASVVYVTKPVVDVTAPSGTYTTDNRPLIQWARTLDSDGGDQTNYRVKIFSSAQYGAGGFDPDTSIATYDSGVRTGNTYGHYTVDGLPNATYRAYVIVAQTVNGEYLWSDWDYSGFVVNTPAPATPNLTASSDSANGRVELVLSDNAGSATTTGFHVQRSLDAGATWVDVRTLEGDGVVTGTDETLWDYEAPNGQQVDYRAYALHDYSGANTPSLAAATDSATWSSRDVWLKAPEQPDLNTTVVLSSWAGHQVPVKQSVVQVLGRRNPVVITDGVGRSGRTGQITVLTLSDADRRAVDALLDSGLVLLLQAPAQYATDPDDTYVVFGQLDRARLVDKATSVDTLDTLPYTEVDAPAGVIIAWPA